MYKFQIVRDQSNERAWDFLLTNNATLISSSLYLPLKTRYNNTMLLIAAAKQKQFEQTGYITGDKVYHRHLAGSTIWKYANRGSSQAFILDKPDLSAALDKPLSFIIKGKDSAVFGKATDLYNLMKENESTLTEIKADEFAEMEAVLLDYKNVLNAPKEEIKEKKTEGTDPIPGLLDELDVIKNHIGKMIQSYFTDLYSKWEEIIKVGSPLGVKKTALVVRFKDNNTSVTVSKVKVMMQKGDVIITKMSSNLGYARFYSLETGNYMMTAEHDEYISYNKVDIGIDENHIERFEVKLSLKEGSEGDPE